jgi:hypothetical protein
MSPSVPEEAGTTARTLISSLASTPVLLSLVVFNLFYIAFSTWVEVQQGARFIDSQRIWAATVDKAMTYCPEKNQ